MKKIFLTVAVMIMVMLPALVKAQGCAICTKTAAGLDDKSARGLNGGILYLAALPLTIIGTVGFIWWRHNRGQI